MFSRVHEVPLFISCNELQEIKQQKREWFMPFITIDDGNVSKRMSFYELVASIVPDANYENVSQAVKEYCKKCGLPEKCTCVDDLIYTSAWIDWPPQVAVKVCEEVCASVHH